MCEGLLLPSALLPMQQSHQGGASLQERVHRGPERAAAPTNSPVDALKELVQVGHSLPLIAFLPHQLCHRWSMLRQAAGGTGGSAHRRAARVVHRPLHSEASGLH